MVLAGLGLEVAEERLRELCDCSPLFGTSAGLEVEAVRSLGFAGTAKFTLGYDELLSLVVDGQFPIVYLSLEAIAGTEVAHAVVVVAADERVVTICDPLYGERVVSRQSFTTDWAARHNLVLLVEH
jgi:hypothetical protein